MVWDHVDYCGKDQIIVKWNGDDEVHTLNGFKRKIEDE